MKKILGLAGVISAVPTLALAHHPLGGMPMETFAQGVLSGVGHPILGFDHLFFVALIGVAALYTGRALLSPFAYIARRLPDDGSWRRFAGQGGYHWSIAIGAWVCRPVRPGTDVAVGLGDICRLRPLSRLRIR